MAKYQSTFAAPTHGMLGHAHDNSGSLVDHRANAAAAQIAFGRAVKASGSGAVLPSSASDEFLGVTTSAPEVPIVDETTGDRKFKQYASMPILSRGRVNVAVEQTVAETDPVFVRFTTVGADTVGAFRKDADNTGGSAATAAVQRKQSLTISGALDGGRGKISTLDFDIAPAKNEGTARVQTLTLSGALDGGRVRSQKLVLSANLDAADTVDGTIAGQAIAQVTFSVDHLTTMELLATATRNALALAGKHGEVYIAGATFRELHIVSDESSATALPLTGWVTGGGATTTFASGTGADVLAGKDPHSLSVTLDGGAALVAEWAGSGDATLAGFADLIGEQTGIASAEVDELTGTGGGVDDGDRVIRVTSSAKGAATSVFGVVTISGGVTARTMAVADATAGVAAAGPDVLDVTVDGTAATQQTFNTGESAADYLARIAGAIANAAIVAGAGPNGGSTIKSIAVDALTFTVRIQSWPGFPTVLSALVFSNVGSGAVAALAAPTANADPHSLSIQLDGGAALVQEWAGTADATLHAFAELLRAQTTIETAEVTPATDTGGGIDDAERVIIVTGTVATAGPAQNAFTNPLAPNGTTPRTMVVAETQAGVAAVAAVAATARAVQWTSARWHKGASAGGIATLEVFRA